MVSEFCETSVRQVAATELPTIWGQFMALGFERSTPNGRLETAVALIMGDISIGKPLVRIHSQCLTGDAFGSLRCDCGEQLNYAMETISDEGAGLVIYENQEGRGIGLMAKLQAYGLQDNGLDTVEANQRLGFAADCRDFALPVGIMRHLHLKHVRLLTNNLQKVSAVTRAGITVERLSCEVTPSPHSVPYLATKKLRMGHILTSV